MSDEYRRMQVKVLYSFDNNPSVFLSRSKTLYSVKVATIPLSDDGEPDTLTLGAFDLKSCVQQVVRSSPENFKLHAEDYAVYHKDITEQPDEPFVANGVISALLAGSKQDLIPGRVCQNLLASFLFGDKAAASSLTLEIRLKFHVIEKAEDAAAKKEPDAEYARALPVVPPRRKRPLASAAAVKATRTKSLPIYSYPPSHHITSIINADKMNAPPKYDSKSISERFKLAPFLLAKIIDKPETKRRRHIVPLTPTGQAASTAQRAMRTRSMVSSFQTVSSPINEELLSEASDDTEYQENTHTIEEADEDDEFDTMQNDSSSPYTPQQPPYKPSAKAVQKPIVPPEHKQFQSLPDLEELDSKRTHTIPSTKLPHDHDLTCINRNCAAEDSVTWRYFETKFHPSYLNIQRAETFDKSLYDGMFGPLCNACYLFLRNKGFMRPEAVVKKYLQQQKYKKDLKLREFSMGMIGPAPSALASSPTLSATPQFHKFATPTHLPSTINEVIKNQNASKPMHTSASASGYSHGNHHAEEFQDLHDFMTQLNNFGGPLTDIDIPNDLQSGNILGATPPMIATKSNTRVINVCADEEDKENLPPTQYTEFEQMMIKSFSLKSSPESERLEQNDWLQFFGEPTPKDNTFTPQVSGMTPAVAEQPGKTSRLSPPKKMNAVANMPSSPLITALEHKGSVSDGSSPLHKARRVDTTMSLVNGHKSSPQSEIYQDETKV